MLLFRSEIHLEARRHLLQVDKRATYLSHRKVDIEEISLKVQKQIQDVRSRIAMARHAADSVKISITNQRLNHPEATEWGCSRSYRVNLTSSTSNSISLIYAVSDYEDRNGLLVYLPSGEPGLNTINDKRDFMAIEMVDRKIKFLWNNGAGTASIIHNATIGKSDIFLRFFDFKTRRISLRVCFTSRELVSFETLAIVI